MYFDTKLLNAAIAAACLFVAMPVLAGGDQNAHNNPTGDPAEDTYQTPYSNAGDGRIMVFCAEDEKLVVTPVDTGAVDISCIPVEN